eukprot:TRINITY_DN6309_c0_g1_i1.p1 TRINITY_DN6309_c0_g1~~TRINITY_DN6309_c0_g1_i1.p1  ORF type:complete len:561 (-),score=161.30 TRINITY_DN6309_c0_g1_i1:159-1841(-)
MEELQEFKNSCCKRRCDSLESCKATLQGCLKQMWDEGEKVLDGDTKWSFANGHYMNMISKNKFLSCGFGWDSKNNVYMTQNFWGNFAGCKYSCNNQSSTCGKCFDDGGATSASTSAPTSAPTTRTTQAPTTRQTPAPTTPAPTTRQTPAPTTRQTPAPTTRQTPAPTARPTEAPTARPTEAPTTRTTRTTTQRPTPAPTPKPTKPPVDDCQTLSESSCTGDCVPIRGRDATNSSAPEVFVGCFSKKCYSDSTICVKKFNAPGNAVYKVGLTSSNSNGCKWGAWSPTRCPGVTRPPPQTFPSTVSGCLNAQVSITREGPNDDTVADFIVSSKGDGGVTSATLTIVSPDVNKLNIKQTWGFSSFSNGVGNLKLMGTLGKGEKRRIGFKTTFPSGDPASFDFSFTCNVTDATAPPKRKVITLITLILDTSTWNEDDFRAKLAQVLKIAKELIRLLSAPKRVTRDVDTFNIEVEIQDPTAASELSAIVNAEPAVLDDQGIKIQSVDVMDTTTDGSSSSDSGLSGGAIAGIVIGVVVGVLLIVVITFFLVKKSGSSSSGPSKVLY